MNNIRSSSPQCRPQKGQTILAEGEYRSFNDIAAGLNDNVLVVGGSGTGKTRGVVRPNILQTAGSYIISDPKGNLYNLYHHYLRLRGYRVERLDFVHPERSTVKYNFFNYIRNQTDLRRTQGPVLGSVRGDPDRRTHRLRSPYGEETEPQPWPGPPAAAPGNPR